MVLNVDYNYLGSSGMKVSNICFGALTFGATDEKSHRPGQLDPTGSYQLLDRFAECGGNFIDTADVYTNRQSETIVGNWLSSKERSRYVIATKVRVNTNPNDPTDVNAVGLSRKHIVAGLEKSLECLQTNYVDLYQAHCWDSGTPIKETLLTFHDLQRAGKIHHIGVSNFCGWQLQKTVDLANHIGMSSILTLQQQYSLMERNAEFEEFQVCQNDGISILPWSPLKGGFLSGKFKRTEAPSAESRIGYTALDEKNRVLETQPGWSTLQSRDDIWLLLDAMKKIAQNHNKSVAQVAIRWLLQRKMVASVIIGAKTMYQLDDNLGASSGWELTCEEMKTLNDLSAPEEKYPYSFIRRFNDTR
ncbi:1-deoxyxylulose-5-phosphate synthase YajO-like [Octopus sinensis]|uniref:1-deoxyxylulose-5-phosphate synthase YajO-like n=1 Tax=Octopus sinensis TaxID=2607531 RepID=A0A6P7TT85_9MOLL|nr:1-deoxyxylulose-5-phosphate synthase YajO-like [Octopus sinensis]